MSNLAWPLLCWRKKTRAAVVHEKAVPRMWTDIDILGVDKIVRMGKPTILESLVRFCDTVETLYTREYLRRPTLRDLQQLLKKAESHGFPGMIGSIDCMDWQ
ncbi:hypothetical protein L3X38_029979 [Prunus dulcis]|uniref:Uncharacterized protein n=1 Tax=Prunus dulcis TaxID=3755 RepID=A0AAD4VTN4_PRUDU|nr:hypothetical protein L3X38_029979 [Prunus dulcis]